MHSRLSLLARNQLQRHKQHKVSAPASRCRYMPRSQAVCSTVNASQHSASIARHTSSASSASELRLPEISCVSPKFTATTCLPHLPLLISLTAPRLSSLSAKSASTSSTTSSAPNSRLSSPSPHIHRMSASELSRISARYWNFSHVGQ